MAERDHFERNDSIETFLPRAINHALPAASDFFQQFVIAKILHRRRLLRDVFEIGVALFKKTQTGSQKTEAAKTSRLVRENRRSALCTYSGFFWHPVLCRSVVSTCTARNSFIGYACNTEMK